MTRAWLGSLRRWGLAACGAALLGLPTHATAGDDADVKARLEAQKRLLDEQRQELEDLQRRLDTLGQGAATFTAQPSTLAPQGDRRLDLGSDNSRVRSAVADYLKEQDQKKKDEDAKKAKEAAEKGYEVPLNNVNLSASWRSGLVLESQNKDFRIHVGGRFDQDSIWWHQPRDLKSPLAPGTGAGLTPGLGVTNTLGIGPLDDGTFFRRVRIQMDGQAYEVMEFGFDIEFFSLSPVLFDEVFVGFKEIPILGTVRLGHHKVPQGLEAFSSQKFLVLMEQTALSDAFWAPEGTGVFVGNTAFNQRLTWQADIAHRIEVLTPFSGAQFGDGDYAYTGRVTMLPVYEQDGRYLLHLGLSEQYRSAQKDRNSNQPGASGGLDSPVAPGSTAANPIFLRTGGDVVRFRSRYDLRDAPGTVGVAGLGNNGRAVDTGNIIADGVWTTGLELLAYWGPFHFTSEATWAKVDRALYPAVPLGGPGTIPGTPFNTNSVPRGDPTFWGVYAQAGWFLTGEHRGYDRRFGRYERVIPNENFFAVRDDRGCFHGGLGAWELIYRYDYIDLNSKGINGGLFGEHTVGLTWYLNPNFHIMVNGVAAHRDVTNSTLVTPAPTVTPISDTVYSLGVRVHYDF